MCNYLSHQPFDKYLHFHKNQHCKFNIHLLYFQQTKNNFQLFSIRILFHLHPNLIRSLMHKFDNFYYPYTPNNDLLIRHYIYYFPNKKCLNIRRMYFHWSNKYNWQWFYYPKPYNKRFQIKSILHHTINIHLNLSKTYI